MPNPKVNQRIFNAMYEVFEDHVLGPKENFDPSALEREAEQRAEEITVFFKVHQLHAGAIGAIAMVKAANKKLAIEGLNGEQ